MVHTDVSITKSEGDSAVLGRVGGVTIPPVVARIFSGDSTSPLTREARMWYLAWDSAVLGGLVQARDGGEAIPPVVARIFSGDSTSPLTREASVVVQSKG